MDLPKLRAIEVELGDGSKVTIHEPKGREGLRVFLSSMPALSMLQKVFTQIQDTDKGETGFASTEIPDEVITAIYRLFGVMTDVTVEQFEGLSVSNQLALLQGFTLFAPKKVSAQAEMPLPEQEVSTMPLTS